jgi:peptide/nickel transport system ATP-binding protein/oligopeptide transport system ATP-binding protein
VSEPERPLALEAVGVRKYFPVKNGFGRAPTQVKAVDGVSLALRQGETFALVGETGCGKSTFGRTAIRLLEPTGGTLKVDGTDITRLSERELRPLRRDMQMVFQDPAAALNPRVRAGDMLREILRIHRLGANAAERTELAVGMLQKVGLPPEHFCRYPHEFSGGQRQRIGLARALILRPKLVVCDEPVSALDASIQAQIINLLMDLQERDGLAYLFIAHDIRVVKHIADRIGVMYLGHLVESAGTEALFRDPLHPYTEALFAAVPEADPNGARRKRAALAGDVPSPLSPPEGCVFHTRCPRALPVCAELAPPLAVWQSGHEVACHALPYG